MQNTTRVDREFDSPLPDDVTGLDAVLLVLFYHDTVWMKTDRARMNQNIFRALLLGTLAIMLIYVLANLAFLRALGFEGVRGSHDAAGDVLQMALGKWGCSAIQLLIALTALGAIQGMIFTGARIYYAMGQDYRLYAWLGRWSERYGTPVNALVVQGAIALALVIGFGWTKQGFSALVNFTTPVFWIFFCLVSIAVIVLRFRRPELERPFRVPFYPILPLIFCLSCLFMVYASLSWAIEQRSSEAFWAIALIVLGIVLSWFNPR
jgi:amino acid transporter